MKKKISLFLVAATLVCSMVGCAGLTRCKECEDEIYEDGYCKYHYELNGTKNKVDELGKDIFNMFGGGE